MKKEVLTLAKIGERLDQMGIDPNLEEDELISDVILVMKVVMGDGTPYVYLTNSDGLDWITGIGMLEVARDQFANPTTDGENDG